MAVPAFQSTALLLLIQTNFLNHRLLFKPIFKHLLFKSKLAITRVYSTDKIEIAQILGAGCNEDLFLVFNGIAKFNSGPIKTPDDTEISGGI